MHLVGQFVRLVVADGVVFGVEDEDHTLICTWEYGVYSIDSYGGKPKVEVIQIDKHHLHLYAGVNPDIHRDALLEMTKWR